MRLVFEASFARDLECLRDRKLLQRIRRILAEVRAASVPGEIKHLEKIQGTDSFYRLRLGDYRIGLEIEEGTVILVRILHRKDIYRYFP